MINTGLHKATIRDLTISAGRGQSPEYSEEETSALAISQKCVRDGVVTSEAARYHSPKMDIKPNVILQDGDVCINSTGTGTIGRVGLWTRGAAGKDQIAFADSHVTVLKTDPEKINSKYLACLLESPAIQNALEIYCYSGSTNQIELSRSALLDLELEILPKDEQDAAAEMFDTIDAAIFQTKEIIAKQQRINTGLMHELLTKGIDENGKIRSEQTHKFFESPIGRIPDGWRTATVEQLLAKCDSPMRSGPFGSALLKAELVDSGIPLLGIDNVHVEKFVSNFTRFVTPKKAEELSRYLVRPTDLMITIMGTVGRCCIVPDNIGKALSSKHVWTLTLDDDVYSPSLACWQFNYAPWVKRHFLKDEQGGVMSAIRSETLRATMFPVPPIEEIRYIESVLSKLTVSIKNSGSKLDKLTRLRNGLMHDLFRGVAANSIEFSVEEPLVGAVA